MRRVHLVGTLGQQDVPTGMALATQRVGQYLEAIPDGEPDDPNWIVDTIERMAGRPEVKTLVPPRFHKDPLRPWHGAVYTARRGAKIIPETLGLAYAQTGWRRSPRYASSTSDDSTAPSSPSTVWSTARRACRRA